MTKTRLIQFVFLLLVTSAYGQKVKYKDIYALLSTKQFQQAEPFLKLYLKETTDNPNAYLFMGNIYQEKASNNDVLKETALALGNMDSAIFFYDKAYKTIDDKEVRKNKEYYQNYNRRDLRTGEFGIKLADIQFDIEKRIETLKDRSAKLKTTKEYYMLADSSYQRANGLFVSLQREYPALNRLYLRADEGTLATLKSLSQSFDSCVQAFQQYKSAISGLGKTGYNQKLTQVEIKDFTIDGRSGADFLADEVKLWDYKKFADKALSVIKEEVLPMRKHLVAYDTEINKLMAKLKKDSVSVRNDLTKLIDKLLFDQLTKFDPHPLPMVVFAVKTTDLAYRSTVLEHKPLRDSADLHLQVALINQELSLLKEIDSLSALLSTENLNEQMVNYADYVAGAYGSASGLQRYLDGEREYTLKEREKKEAMLAHYKKRLNYIIDGTDSIPLSSDVVSAFKPLWVTPEKFTMGLSFSDPADVKGYFYTITASRTPEVKAYFPVDKALFDPSTLGMTRGLAYSDPAGQIFYVLIFSERPVKDRFPGTLAKIYRSDGLAWKVDYQLGFPPTELALSADGDLVIGNGELQFRVDKNGKLVR